MSSSSSSSSQQENSLYEAIAQLEQELSRDEIESLAIIAVRRRPNSMPLVIADGVSPELARAVTKTAQALVLYLIGQEDEAQHHHHEENDQDRRKETFEERPEQEVQQSELREARSKDREEDRPN